MLLLRLCTKTTALATTAMQPTIIPTVATISFDTDFILVGISKFTVDFAVITSLTLSNKAENGSSMLGFMFYCPHAIVMIHILSNAAERIKWHVF